MEDYDVLQTLELRYFDHMDIGSSMCHRCELYLALSIASLVSISGIISTAPSRSRYGVKTTAIILSSLSFIVTLKLGVGYFSRRVRYIRTANTRTQHKNEKNLQKKVSLEKMAASFILLLDCFLSGFLLYPRFDANLIAVAGDELWNPNLFYVTWFSLYASAYLVVLVFVNEDYSTPCHLSVKTPWLMSIFSSTCAAISLLIISSGPTCKGKVIDDISYCFTSLAAGSGSVICALALLMCGACHQQHVREKLRRLMMVIGTTILSIIQCSMVAAVTRPLGPGHVIGNAFIASWMSLLMSLILWKNTVASYLVREPGPEPTSKGYVRSDTSVPTDDEGSIDEDLDNICDPDGDMVSDIPSRLDPCEVLDGEMIYSHNLCGPDPEEDLSFYPVFQYCIQSKQNQAHVEGSQVLEEADAILLKVAELIRRKDPRGILLNMEPPASQDRAVARARRSHCPDSNLKKSMYVNKKDGRSHPLAPLPKNTDTSLSSLPHHIQMNQVSRSTKSLSPSVQSCASELYNPSSKGAKSRSGVSLKTEISCNKHGRTPSPPLPYTQQDMTERAANEPNPNKKWSPRTPLTAFSPDIPSPDSTVPFDVLLRDDQTEISSWHISTPIDTNADKRKLSVAVAAALHAATITIDLEQEVKVTTDKEKIRALIDDSVTSTAEIDQYFSSYTQHQLEGLSVSLQSFDMLHEALMSPMTGDLSQSSTLKHAKKINTYSDLEDSKLNIHGNHRPHTPNNTSIVGILKHSQYSGSHRETPSQASSKSSQQASSPRNKSPASYSNEKMMRRNRAEDVSIPMNGLRFDNRSLP